MDQLRTLLIYINLSDFGFSPSAPPGENLAANVLAATHVVNVTWTGLQTKVPFAASDLSKDFLQQLNRFCGAANVSVVPKREDRYAGQMVDVVISR